MSDDNEVSEAFEGLLRSYNKSMAGLRTCSRCRHLDGQRACLKIGLTRDTVHSFHDHALTMERDPGSLEFLEIENPETFGCIKWEDKG